MTGRALDIEDAPEGSFTDLLDSRLYFTAAPCRPAATRCATICSATATFARSFAKRKR